MRFPEKMTQKNIAIVALSLITIFNLGLHIFKLSYPSRPVFDEAHFATYSADYINNTPRFDIHPPLGKMLYAATLLLFDKNDIKDASFVSLQKNIDGSFSAVLTDKEYGEFPYVYLRLLSVLFGVLLPFATYYFLRSVGVGYSGSILGALFVVADSALLLQTRLILIDGMFLFFGLTALSLYFSNRNIWLAGLILGLAISTKLTAIVFLGPILASILIAEKRNREFKKAFKFLGIGLAVLFAISVTNFVYFSPPSSDLYLSSARSSEYSYEGSSGAKMFAQNIFFSISNYIFDSKVGSAHPMQSPWYFWLVGKGKMSYYSGAEPIILVGNLVLWVAVFVAVIYGLARWLINHLYGEEKSRTGQLLLGGYLFSLLPFIFFIRRTTFLYHYLPSSIFGVCLLAWTIEHYKFKKNTIMTIILLVIFGLVINLKNIYGG